MGEQDREVSELLKRLAEAEARGEEVIVLSRREAAAIRAVAQFWLAGEAVGFFAGWIGGITKWLAVMIGLWIAFKAGILEWIRAGLAGGQQ